MIIITGTNKKMNFPYLKQIRVNEIQKNNWNNKAIRSFLDGNFDNRNMLNDFKRLYQIMNLYLIGKLTPSQMVDLKEVLNEIENIEEVYNFE